MPHSVLHHTYEQLLGGLAILLLLSGLDDLIPTLLCLWNAIRHGQLADEAPETNAERRIAVFVPCWHESKVIGQMVRHNLAAIKYQRYDFFLGVYPNDEPTTHVARELSAGIKNVHVAVCPHNGPTSKADCLNAIYQRMRGYEAQHEVHFDTVVIHDAEDLIHADALQLINRERSKYEMVQVPVLPLPTPLGKLTHGVYCDDFAEYQMIDMRARQISNSFIPSNGVGTAYSRKVLEHLARSNYDVVFEPSSLTEDYDSGVRIHLLGFSQKFCALQRKGTDYLATREYFPLGFRAAVRQRTRWVMGNVLQSWERHRWKGSTSMKYWLWRDRKGLVANPISLATNILFIAGLVTWCSGILIQMPWPFEVSTGWVVNLCAVTFGLQWLRLGIRMECVRRTFGGRMALFVPPRTFWGNLINALASVQAAFRYTSARLRGGPLPWLKTDHAYPDQETRSSRHRSLEDVLIGSGALDEGKLQSIQARLGTETELADYLVHSGDLCEEELSETLALKEGVPSVYLNPSDVNPKVARVFPAGSPVVPFRVERGRLLVAGPRPLESGTLATLKKFTNLQIDFYLVTWRNFEELQRLLI